MNLIQAGITSFDALMRATGDTTMRREVRLDAGWALGKLGKKRATTALIAVFSEDIPTLYWEAAKSVGLLRSKRVVPQLITILQHDSSAEKRAAATYALGLIGDERARSVLLHIVRDTAEVAQVRGYTASGRHSH